MQKFKQDTDHMNGCLRALGGRKQPQDQVQVEKCAICFNVCPVLIAGNQCVLGENYLCA